MKLGMMPYNDSFKGVLFDADMAGLPLSSSYGKFSPSIGYFRFNDNGEVTRIRCWATYQRHVHAGRQI